MFLRALFFCIHWSPRAARNIGVPIFYINVNGVGPRNEYMQTRFEDQQLYRVSALDLNNEDIRINLGSSNNKHMEDLKQESIKYPKVLSEAVLLGSHRKMIELARDMGFKRAIFMEDDASPWGPNHWMDHVDRILRNLDQEGADDWECIRLQYSNYIEKKIAPMLLSDEPPQFFMRLRMHAYIYGAVAFLLNDAGMEKFLNRTADPTDGKLVCPIDRCEADVVIDKVFEQNSIVAVPAPINCRYFEGSSGVRTGRVEGVNSHFKTHATNMMETARFTAQYFEKTLISKPSPYFDRWWEVKLLSDLSK